MSIPLTALVLVSVAVLGASIAPAEATGSIAGGAATMVVLGVTSAVPLVVIAFGGYGVAHVAGRRMPQVGGVLMLLMGAMILYRSVMTSGAVHPMHH